MAKTKAREAGDCPQCRQHIIDRPRFYKDCAEIAQEFGISKKSLIKFHLESLHRDERHEKAEVEKEDQPA